MLITTERPTAFQIARHAWSSLFDAVPRMAPLFLVCAILMVALEIAVARLPGILAVTTREALRTISKSGDQVTIAAALPSFGLDMAQTAISAVITAPIAVAMHRFILLGEIRRFAFLSSITLRFAAWIFAFKGLARIYTWIMVFAEGAPGGVKLLLAVLGLGMVGVLIKALLLYPAVALDEQSADFSSRVETALERSSGIFWLMIGAFAISICALVLALVPLVLVEAAVASLLDNSVQASLMRPVLIGLISPLVVALGAAILSWLYSYAAHRKADAEITP